VQCSAGAVALAQSGRPGDPGIEDVLAITLHFVTGAVGTIGCAWTAPGTLHVHSLDVLDHRSTVTLDLGSAGYTLSGQVGADAVSGIYGSPMERSVRRFLAVATDGGDGVFCTPADALGTLRVAVACETALAQGGGVRVEPE
jgi:predicted dehydrogenase